MIDDGFDYTNVLPGIDNGYIPGDEVDYDVYLNEDVYDKDIDNLPQEQEKQKEDTDILFE